MKKFLSVIICICLLLQAVGTLGVLAEDTADTEDDVFTTELEQCGDQAWWQIVDDVLTISGSGDMWNWDFFNASAPWIGYSDIIRRIVIEEGITSIGQNAFCSEDSYYDYNDHIYSILNEIVIPDTVSTIYTNAISGIPKLETLTIPASVTSLEHSALNNNYAMKAYYVDEDNTAYQAVDGVVYSKDGTTLVAYPIGSLNESYTVPDGTLTIAAYAFSQCSSILSEITFNDELEFIDDEAFQNCDGLTAISLPDSLKRLGGGVFQECSALADIHIPSTMERIGPLAFDATAYYFDRSNWTDGVLYLDSALLTSRYLDYSADNWREWIEESKEGPVSILPGTTIIADEAFFLSDVTAVTFNGELLYIGDSAFYGLDILEITLPAGLKSLGDRAFYECELLGNISMSSDIEYIGSDVFDGTAYDNNANNYVDGVLYYRNYLLDYNSDLPDNVVIVDGTTLIAAEAFFVLDNYRGANMNSITFPASLTTICDGAFYSCYNLKEVEIPSTVTTIGQQAFGYVKAYDYALDRETFSLMSNFTIQCEEGSAAEAYAIANGIAYERPPIRATSMKIDRYGYSSLFSYSDDLGTYVFSVVFEPIGCVTEKVTWTSNDVSVATVDSRGYVTTRGVGNATITATSENGLIATYPVTIVDAPYITADKSYEIEFDAEGNYRKCLFTPTESGEYTFSLGDSSIRMKLYEDTGKRLDDHYGYCEGELEEGVTYKITMTPDYNICAATKTLTITKKQGGGSAGEVVTPATIVGLTVTCTPDKMEYDLYEPFDNTGMVVELVYSDGSQQVFTNYFIDGYDSDTPGTKTLRVWFSDFADTFDVIVNNTAYVDPDAPTTSLFIASLPNKVTYTQGEALNTTGMVVEVHWADGSESWVSGWRVSGYDPNYIGTQTITVTWEGLTATFMVDVYAGEDIGTVDVYPIGITVTPPTKTTYIQGEKLNMNGATALLTYSNGDKRIVHLSSDQVTGYNSSKVGKQTLTVTYDGLTATFRVTVVAKALTSIAVTSKPNKVSYIQGDSLSTTGMKLKLTYNDGATKTVTSGWKATANLTKTGSKVPVTVTYGGKSTSYTVKVSALGTPKASVSNTSKGIYLKWGKISGADKYYIYRRTGSGSWSKIKTTTSTSYTDTKASAGKSYTYRVRAVNGSYTGGYKTTASIRRLKAPGSIKLAKASKGFKVTWSKVSGAKYYEVYRRTGSGSWKKIKTTSSTSYTDKTAKKGTYYTYRVRATYGESDGVFKTGNKTKR